jgi:hypothetical protein
MTWSVSDIPRSSATASKSHPLETFMARHDSDTLRVLATGAVRSNAPVPLPPPWTRSYRLPRIGTSWPLSSVPPHLRTGSRTKVLMALTRDLCWLPWAHSRGFGAFDFSRRATHLTKLANVGHIRTRRPVPTTWDIFGMKIVLATRRDHCLYR